MDNSKGAPAWRRHIDNLLGYFNVADDLLPQADVEQAIREGVSFRGSQLLVLIFAILVASLGLNTNSVPVVIGAMLISPLMGPIMGMGLALGVEDFTLLRKGLKNIAMAIIGSVAASAIYFLISPQYEGSSQLLARTSPSIYDVFIALFGGAAGIVSTACRNKGQVMPGVAIATSLMPPLCTAGYGLATWQLRFFAGAFYLFFTNMIFILFATWIGVKLMGYKRHTVEITKRYRRVQTLVYTIVAATIGISALLTIQMISKNIFLTKAADFVDSLNFPNTQVLNHREFIANGKRHIDVTLIGAQLPKDSLQLALTSRLDSIGLGGTLLNIKQGFSISSPTERDEDDDRFYQLLMSQLSQSRQRADSLQRIIDNRSSLYEHTMQISPELKVLFPAIKDVAVTRVLTAATTDTLRRDTLNMVFLNAPAGISMAERQKIADYLSVRLGVSDIHLAVNPPAFPWPRQPK